VLNFDDSANIIDLDHAAASLGRTVEMGRGRGGGEAEVEVLKVFVDGICWRAGDRLLKFDFDHAAAYPRRTVEICADDDVPAVVEPGLVW
jgi:hypothetical protein